MLKFCLDKWEENKDTLRGELALHPDLENLRYIDLVKLVVDLVFNRGDSFRHDKWSTKNITCIDDGDYQGTLLFMIPKETYQPGKYEYLLTAVEYGSCSGCDTLQRIQMAIRYGEDLSARALDDLMVLCKDIVTSTVHPFESPWTDELDEKVGWL